MGGALLQCRRPAGRGGEPAGGGSAARPGELGEQAAKGKGPRKCPKVYRGEWLQIILPPQARSRQACKSFAHGVRRGVRELGLEMQREELRLRRGARCGRIPASCRRARGAPLYSPAAAARPIRRQLRSPAPQCGQSGGSPGSTARGGPANQGAALTPPPAAAPPCPGAAGVPPGGSDAAARAEGSLCGARAPRRQMPRVSNRCWSGVWDF